MNFPPNNGHIPVIGQQPQGHVLQAAVLITPALLKKLQVWEKQTGIPFNEIGQTIFRMGLIGLSMNIDDPSMTTEQAIECIPLTDNEKEARFN